VARTRLIVGLITPHRIFPTIRKPVREAKGRSRAILCMYVCESIDLPHFFIEGHVFTALIHMQISSLHLSDYFLTRLDLVMVSASCFVGTARDLSLALLFLTLLWYL
jgi:hypothetical protein